MPSSQWMDRGELDRMAQTVIDRAPALSLYARQWVDANAAEDVLQEALTALLGQRPGPDDPIAWMYRAVRNAAIDYARASSRRRRREQAIAQGRVEWFETRADSLMDARTAEHALRQLPDEEREIVVLRIWGELTLAQIARIMRRGVTTIHERYASAMSRLRQALEDPCKSRTH